MAASTRVRLLTDRWMRWLVTAGGLAIIVSVLGILFFIVAQVLPLLREARVETEGWSSRDRPRRRPSSVRGPWPGTNTKPWRRCSARDGVARIFRADDGQEVAQRVVVDPAVDAVLALSAPPGSTVLAASTRRGQVVLQPTSFLVTFDGDKRQVEGQLGEPVRLELDPAGQPLGVFAAQLDDDGGAGAAAQLASGSIAVVERRVSRNAMTGELSEEIFRGEATVPADAGKLSAMVLDGDRRNLFAGSETGWLLWWELADGVPGPPHRARSQRGAPVTALDLLIGGRSLVVGGADGGVAVWFPVRATATDGSESSTLTRVREFPRRGGAITQLASSARNRSFLVADAAGELGLYFSTSERVLWSGPAPVPAVDGLAYSPKGDGALIAGGGRLAKLQIDNPHPEISWRALFGKVWYEGYDEPAHVWQSTGGTDDFESKLGLVPLVIGTLKGTFYSLLIAIPLGVFGAMFASQFMHPRLLRVVKPAVEVMAALPSVVLGFLAGLWLAPRVESGFPALILAVVFLPLAVLVAGVLWRAVPMSLARARAGRHRDLLLRRGTAPRRLGVREARPGVRERSLFGGSFQDWLLRATGLPYDQRNAVVVGLAMGFAVIPIIFAISEDAFSNVPRDLISGSLALGADRWQTVTRVVLPTASPGIFSAVMIGFGRAVGETMIVLMATGNTPILDWNPFNGFRTLSANIAVEIPEAPQSAAPSTACCSSPRCCSSSMTFVVNTAAELVRQRLRRKYAEL